LCVNRGGISSGSCFTKNALQEVLKLSERNSVFDTITGFIVPVHRDGHKFVAIAALVTLLFFFLWSPLGWLGAIITGYIAYFFRDPERVTPVRAGLVLSPADGKVSSIETITPPAELGLGDEPLTRISIFLSVFDVHINRAPVTGTVSRKVYTPGLFLNAELDKASADNERLGMVIEADNEQQVAVVQIAGLVARRIISFVKEGDRLGMGERFGLIRFGSRVDVYLPKDCNVPLVAVGQRAVGGETVLADINSDETEREVRTS
jgi:phosphatidylserine decarboxylase